MTLREIANGYVTFDNIKDLPAQRRAEEAAEQAGNNENDENDENEQE